MCGRYTLTRAERYAQERGLTFDEFDIRPRYNIAPTQRVAIVFDASPAVITSARWGLIPFWAKDEKIGASLINARAETVATKPAFRAAFKKRRCLIPADGFYEWQRVGAGKIPHRIVIGDGDPFAFAGLWETWTNPTGEPLRSCAIITCTPNALTAPIHDRMPVILPRGSESTWLAPETPAETLASLLTPYPPDSMRAYAVSTRVNIARNDEPANIEPTANDG